VKLKLLLPLAALVLLFEANSVSFLRAATNKKITRPYVIVSAAIGIPKMTLWGYTSPFSTLELTGSGVNQFTNSDESGYYSFDLVYLPSSGTFPELCITAVDQEKRITPPTCIPPVPEGNYFYDVGPVILPPTISLGAPETHTGSQVSAQGQTIPGSNIEIKLAHPDMEKSLLSFQIVRSALAYYVPSFNATADASGNYSFNMPTTRDTTWRVFTIADIEAGRSPKSNTLKFDSLSAASIIWKAILAFLLALFSWPRILILILFLIIIILTILIIHIRNKNNKRSQQKISKDIN